MHLEIERADSPWDRAVKAANVVIPANEWTELHATFKVEKPFTEGWSAYISCAQQGARFRADMFRLYEGEYVPWKAAAQGTPAGAQAAGNPFKNPSFETGAGPWRLSYGGEQYNLRRTYRRASFLLTRLLANMGAAGAAPVLERFHTPVNATKPEKRWLDGLYLDVPIEWDDPYRFFRW
jgi:hypothetical protein